MKLNPLSAALAFGLAAVPALANPVTSVKAHLMRDSDGIVISVIDVPIKYYDFEGGVLNGGVYYTMNGGVMPRAVDSGGPLLGSTSGAPGTQVILGGSELALAHGTSLSIGGVTYRIEADGDAVWLIDRETGQRYATTRHMLALAPDAKGLTVNPAVFGLD